MAKPVTRPTAAFIKGLTSDAPGDKGGKNAVAILTLSSRPTINTNYTTDQAALLSVASPSAIHSRFASLT